MSRHRPRVVYEFPDVSAPSVEYQIVRQKRQSAQLHVRLEYDPARIGDATGLAGRLAERIHDRLGVAAQLALVARGEFPRFAYKAERVVDE